MIKKTTITVITVCLNSQKTIRKTIESLNSQVGEFEYIIIDGGSTDDTLSIIDSSISASLKERTKIFSQPDGGIYDAMNKGISRSSGEYLAFLNSDDWYEKDAIKAMELSIRENPSVDIFYGYIRILKNNSEYMVRRNSYDFVMEGHGLIQHPTCFIRRSAYFDVGLYDTRYRVCADQDMILRLISAGKKYYAVDAIITNFSRGGISDSYNSRSEVLRFKCSNNIISKKEYILLSMGFRVSLFFKSVLTMFNR